MYTYVTLVYVFLKFVGGFFLSLVRYVFTYC